MDKKILLWIIGIALLLPIVSAGKVNYTTYSSCASDSMAPAFDCHDKLIVNTVNPQDVIVEGDVYCYRADTRSFNLPWYYYICHRFIYYQDNHLIFAGDNNPFEDEPIERKYVAWKIINY